MPSSTVEDYVKQIYLEQQAIGQGPVAMGRVAELLGVVPGTATTMMKSLQTSGLITYEPRIGVRLTVEGDRLALLMLRRHRLIEAFLVQVLGYDWSEIHDDAEALEHAVSDKMLERIDEILGQPKFDPHGDPIPSASGQMARRKLFPLSEVADGETVRVARLLNQATPFLQFAEANGLKPGAVVSVTDHNPAADALTLMLEAGKPLSLSSSVALSILVEKTG